MHSEIDENLPSSYCEEVVGSISEKNNKAFFSEQNKMGLIKKSVFSGKMKIHFLLRIFCANISSLIFNRNKWNVHIA